MSSLIRRIQRSQPHKKLVKHRYTGSRRSFTETVTVPGRKQPFQGRGSKLGHTNPKAKDLLARKAREAKRNQQKGN